MVKSLATPPESTAILLAEIEEPFPRAINGLESSSDPWDKVIELELFVTNDAPAVGAEKMTVPEVPGRTIKKLWLMLNALVPKDCKVIVALPSPVFTTCPEPATLNSPVLWRVIVFDDVLTVPLIVRVPLLMLMFILLSLARVTFA